MAINERVRIGRRFLRSIRIDVDLGDTAALEGFVCPQSSADVLTAMARHVSETGQGAFTWTGPYGSGKSSLVVALSALLNGKTGLQKEAAGVLGKNLAKTIWNALPTGTKGWRILPVVARRDDPVAVIGESVKRTGLVARLPRDGWTESSLIDALTGVAASRPKTHGGLVLLIDEMGKFLEAAAQDGSDIYILQQLAEAASRSKGRLLVIGVLHQAFEEYAHRLSHEIRDEWAKIQGRFIDLVVNTVGEEQIDLISRAIESDHRPEKPGALASAVAGVARRERTGDAARLAVMLEACWPLHPVVACLLGPMSRRRFGQNQRSIFGFLNSSEPHGFQDYLNRDDEEGELYGPDRLWDYLRANLEPSILASPDGHRWALAAEALERCESIGGDALHIRLLKTIAVIDLFKERSGLVANFDLLRTCFPGISDKALEKALSKLDTWSFTIFKKFLDARAIFAGSDFDIDGAVRAALDEIDEVGFKELKSIAGLQPILAKRHYHDTGALRWFDVNVVPVGDLVEFSASLEPENGAIGQFLLAIPTEGESEDRAEDICRKAARHSDAWEIVVGISERSWAVVPLARELFALERVSNDHPELAGDPVARREVSARLAALQALLEVELNKAFDSALWFRKGHQPKGLRQADLNGLASELADRRFAETPRLHSELLSRQKPSSNAIAAQKALLRRMVLHDGEERLGIKGYPAEGGLFESVLEATGLYASEDKEWRFVSPTSGNDPRRLAPLWSAALNYVKECDSRTVAVSEIFDLWRRPPFGVKEGLMPILAVAFILSQDKKLAVYRNGIFRTRLDDVDVDYLAKDPSFIQVRWMDLTDVARRLLSGMAQVVRDLDQANELVHLEPIDVGRGLVAIYDRLPRWTELTMRLSANAVKIRDLFKRAHDPNQFLFDDIPETLGGDVSLANENGLHRIVASVREGLEELVLAYPSMLHRLRDIMLAELQVPNVSPQSLAELRKRAENVRQLAGDFRLDAFVGRLVQFDGSDESFEGIASLAANKPPREWVDPDIDRAAIELADMAQKFLRVETYARVQGRPDKRQAMAVIVGMDGRPAPLLEEFVIANSDRVAVNDLIERVVASLEEAETSRRNVILAALAELSTRYMQDSPSAQKHGKGRAAS